MPSKVLDVGHPMTSYTYGHMGVYETPASSLAPQLLTTIVTQCTNLVTIQPLQLGLEVRHCRAQSSR